jgi:hypothetical protein
MDYSLSIGKKILKPAYPWGKLHFRERMAEHLGLHVLFQIPNPPGSQLYRHVHINQSIEFHPLSQFLGQQRLRCNYRRFQRATQNCLPPDGILG